MCQICARNNEATDYFLIRLADLSAKIVEYVCDRPANNNDLSVKPCHGGGFRQWILPHLIGESVVTWRGYEFPPGLLDVVTFTPGPLEARNGFVLGTAELNQEELDRLGVQSEDSSVSDHLIMVSDFNFVNR